MSKGHDNIAAIGSLSLNEKWNTNFQNSLRKGDNHAEVSVLKENLRLYRTRSDADWMGVPNLSGNTSNTLDEQTELNLIKFQELEGVRADGIYGQASRNRMAAKIGQSSKGFVRLDPSREAHYINFNDTVDGLNGDKTYLLDYSWITKESVPILGELADSFHRASGKALQINDCSLIDGAVTPEHSSHQTGKEFDIRNFGFSTEEEKKFLEICLENTKISKVLFYDLHGLPSGKLEEDISHKDHFHVVSTL